MLSQFLGRAAKSAVKFSSKLNVMEPMEHYSTLYNTIIKVHYGDCVAHFMDGEYILGSSLFLHSSKYHRVEGD